MLSKAIATPEQNTSSSWTSISEMQLGDAVVARLVELGDQFRSDVDLAHLAEVANPGQHLVLALAGDHAGAGHAQQHALFELEQGDHLLQQAAGEILQVALLEQVGRGGDHALQAFAVTLLGAARILHLHDVAVGTQRGKGGGEQLGAVEFRLFLVIVDVVIDDHAFFRRLAGLAGAQHDAGELVVLVLAQPARHFQAAVFALHHHVQEHQRNVLLACQHLLGFFAAVGMQKGQGAAVETEARQGQLGDVMDIRFVVDEQDFPGCEFGRSGRQEGHRRPSIVNVSERLEACARAKAVATDCSTSSSH
jgi:hypothetical protein